MRIWELIRQSGHNVVHARLRTGLTALGVAIATGALVSMVGFAAGLQEQMEAPFEKLGPLHNIEVRAKDVDDDADDDVSTSSGKPSAPALDDEAIRRLESLPGVQAAYPDLRLSEITVRRGKSSYSAYAVGLPREAGFVGFVEDLLSAGKYISVSDA
jgi:ABC-type antimicrobial peptide transport system permease subunit